MTKTDLEREILRLPLAERLELAQAIWESVEGEPSPPALPEWQRQILDERIAEDDKSTGAGSSWDEVKRRILASL